MNRTRRSARRAWSPGLSYRVLMRKSNVFFEESQTTRQIFFIFRKPFRETEAGHEAACAQAATAARAAASACPCPSPTQDRVLQPSL